MDKRKINHPLQARLINLIQRHSLINISYKKKKKTVSRNQPTSSKNLLHKYSKNRSGNKGITILSALLLRGKLRSSFESNSRPVKVQKYTWVRKREGETKTSSESGKLRSVWRPLLLEEENGSFPSNPFLSNKKIYIAAAAQGKSRPSQGELERVWQQQPEEEEETEYLKARLCRDLLCRLGQANETERDRQRQSAIDLTVNVKGSDRSTREARLGSHINLGAGEGNVGGCF